MTISEDLAANRDRLKRIEREIDRYWNPRLGKAPCPMAIREQYLWLIRTLRRTYKFREVSRWVKSKDIHVSFPLGINPGEDWDHLRDLANVLHRADSGQGFIGESVEQELFQQQQSRTAQNKRPSRQPGLKVRGLIPLVRDHPDIKAQELLDRLEADGKITFDDDAEEDVELTLSPAGVTVRDLKTDDTEIIPRDHLRTVLGRAAKRNT